MSELPQGWVETTLGEALEWSSGGTPPRADPANFDGGIPWVVIGDLNEGVVSRTTETLTEAGLRNSAAKWVEPGSVMLGLYGSIGATGSVGKTGIAGLRLTTNQAIAFTMPQCCEPRYLQWYLRHHKLRLQEVAKGGNQTNLSQTVVKRYPFKLAPRPEQERIVKSLDEHDSRLRHAVEEMEASRRRLAAYRAAVLRAACEGRLVPTEAELARAEGRTYEPASELLARVPRAPRPNRYESRSREVIPGHAALAVGNPGTPVPEGWTWAALVEIAKMESGHTPSRSHPEWWGGQVPWITLPDARDHHGRTILTTQENTNTEGLANSAARLLPAGTVCLSRTASVGYVTVMGRPMATSQDFVNWVPTECVTSSWLRIVFISDREALRRFGKGSVHKTIYFPECLSLHAAIPPLAEQKRIVAEVERRLSVVERLEAAIDANLARAKRLRQAILKRAFEGRLVPQDPNDEPAGVLLERIKRERETSSPALGRRPRGRR